MAKLVSKRITTTVTEEMELVPATPGEEKGHRYLKVSLLQPQIMLKCWILRFGEGFRRL